LKLICTKGVLISSCGALKKLCLNYNYSKKIM